MLVSGRIFQKNPSPKRSPVQPDAWMIAGSHQSQGARIHIQVLGFSPKNTENHLWVFHIPGKKQKQRGLRIFWVKKRTISIGNFIVQTAIFRGYTPEFSTCICFLLTLSLPLFYSSLLCFESVHTVGSFETYIS